MNHTSKNNVHHLYSKSCIDQSYYQELLPVEPLLQRPLSDDIIQRGNSNTVAHALLAFSSHDTDGDGVLSMKELRDAMKTEKSNIDVDNMYGGLVNSEKNISREEFIMGLHKRFGPQDDIQIKNPKLKRTPMKWASINIFLMLLQKKRKLLSIVKEKKGVEEEDEEEDANEDGEEARALSSVLFQIMDVECNGVITIDTLRAGLKEVDPEIFSNEIMDEIIEQLDDSGTNFVNESEFTVSFSALAASNLEEMRRNIDKYKKKKQSEKDTNDKSLILAISLVCEDSKNDNDDVMERWENSYDVVQARTQLLEHQLRQAKSDIEKIKRRFKLVQQENSISQAQSKILIDQNQILRKNTPRNLPKLEDEKIKHMKITEALETRMKTLEKELQQAKKSKQVVKETLRKRDPSLIARLEKDLDKKDTELKEKNKTLIDYTKALKKAQIKQKKINAKLRRMKREVAHVSLLKQEIKQLQAENKKLQMQILQSTDTSVISLPVIKETIPKFAVDNKKLQTRLNNLQNKLQDKEYELEDVNQKLKIKVQELERIKDVKQKLRVNHHELKKTKQELENLKQEMNNYREKNMLTKMISIVSVLLILFIPYMYKNKTHSGGKKK